MLELEHESAVEQEYGKRMTRSATKTTYTVSLYAAYALLAIGFSVIYMKSTHPSVRAPLNELASFTARRPYQFRILVPAIVHLLHWVLGINLVNAFGTCTVISTFMLLVVFRKYLSLFLSQTVSDAAAPLILYPIVWNYCVLNCWYFPSDIPAIAFFVLGLVLMIQGKMPWYYLSFVLAAFNRETICFLIPAYGLAMYDKVRPTRLCAHLVALTAIWLGIRWLILWAFAANPGDSLERHIRTNIYVFVQLLHLNPMFMWVFLAFGLIWLLIPFAWGEQPQFFKRMFWVIPLFLVGMYFVGVLREVRIYAEIIPILTAPAIVGVQKIVREKHLG